MNVSPQKSFIYIEGSRYNGLEDDIVGSVSMTYNVALNKKCIFAIQLRYKDRKTLLTKCGYLFVAPYDWRCITRPDRQELQLHRL